MEKFEKNVGNDVYVAPVIEDYGTLQELTASGGASFVDMPVGTAVANSPNGVVGSTP